ncbi:protein C19orf12 homolog [Ixodes scapularis]|uniref:protein C19orf12 homolog n=1 Tax=Ixodes scapularis TaxID=6945 RepID=UPI001A9D41D3|nr:protein C19orf12 homolog [Ixodes scapularis]
MRLKQRQLLYVLTKVADDENLQVVEHSYKTGASLAGSGAFFGANLLGPVGIIAGAVIGGVVAYLVIKKLAKAFSQIIDNMSEGEKDELCMEIEQAFPDADITDVDKLEARISADPHMKKRIISILERNIKKKTSKEITDFSPLWR